MKKKVQFTYILEMFTRLKRVAAFFLALTFFSALPGCTGRPTASDPSKTVGVGRPAEYLQGGAEQNEIAPDGTGGTAGDQPPLDGVSASSDEIWWKFENEKYVYNFPSPDRSGLSDLTDINNTSRALLPDQGADTSGSWWMGQMIYDASTREATSNYDRSAETKQLLADNLGIYRGDESRKVCYFTFDCGYENGYTDIIMDVLKEKGVAGTFFVTGQYVKTAQTQIRRMIDEGHIVGNHTVNHPNMVTDVTAEEFIDEIEGLEQMVKEAFPDAQPMLYYRPPEGATNEWALKLAAKMGIRTVVWSFTYKDYDPNDQLDYYTALEKVKSGLHPGCVYLFHAVSKTNSEILGEFIDWVRGQGYEILPICDIDMKHE